MAKRPPARPRRVRATDQVQPGAVAAEMSVSFDDGTMVRQDAEALDKDSEAAKQAQREAFLRLARHRFKLSEDAESQLRRDMLDDLRFYNSDQWPEDIKATRFLDGRPTLTINRLPAFVRQVVNAQRESKPAIQYSPVDNGADPDTAEIFQGIARLIERSSRAHVAYTTAGEYQAIIGRGWFRLLTEYARDDSFEQEIRIRRVMDPFTVYPDPAVTEPDHSDSTFCFITENIPTLTYRTRYGEAARADATFFQSFGDTAPDWCHRDGVRVAEYFYVELVPYELAKVRVEGQTIITMPRDAVKAEDLKPRANGLGPRVEILDTRQSERRQVKWALINGVQILEGNEDKTAGRDLPGPYIPVIPVIGEELVVDGRKNIRGMVRDAKDPQRTYNFWVSAETEMIALAPRAPVVGAAGQFEGHEQKWSLANKRNYPYLEYNPIDLNGQLVPPPQRAAYDPNVGPIIQATMQADRDLKSVLGMFDASQEHSREQSGKAILARQAQGESGTSHFLDNLARSIEHAGRILLHWIPVYYSAPRMLRIFGADDTERDVLVHAGQPDQAQETLSKADQRLQEAILRGRPFDLSVGRYDVSVSVGPSFQSRRQESVESIIQLVSAYPAILPVVGDILVRNMDWPGARELSERLKRMVPPEARDPEGGGPEIPPEVLQQLQAMEEQLKAAMLALEEKDRVIQTKQIEAQAKHSLAQLELEGKARLEEIKARAEIAKIHAETNAEKALALFESKMAELSQRLEHAHQEHMQAQDRLFTLMTPEPPPEAPPAEA